MAYKVEGFTFTWTIENFSMLPHQREESLKSDMFVVAQGGNIEWYLLLFPRGYNNSDGNFSLYLCTTAKDLELKLTVSFTIVATEPSSDISFLIENRSNNLCCCIPNSERLNDIFSNKQNYLPNDTRTLRCTIKPIVEETIVQNNSETVVNFLGICKSRTVIQVNRRCITLLVRNIKELLKLQKNATFVMESAFTKSAGLKITLHFTESANKDFVKIEIRQTNLPLEEERLFVKCKMTVISAHKKYQDSNESTHLFRSSLNDIWCFPTVIKISNLTLDKYLYQDDTLLLQCEFAFSCKSAVHHLENNYMPLILEPNERSGVSGLVPDAEELDSSGKSYDVQLLVGGETVAARKFVLCAMSPVFRAMFKNDSKENVSSVVEIEDVEPDTLRKMLTFMHSNDLMGELSFENICLLFSAADKYDLGTLRRRCSTFLVSTLSVTSVCDVLILADTHQDNFLLTAVHNFIYNHTNETFYSEHWKRFMKLYPNLSGEIMHQWIKNRLL